MSSKKSLFSQLILYNLAVILMRDDTFKDNGDQFKASYMNQAANVVFSMRCRRNVCTQNNRARENTINANFASEVCACDVKRCH